MHQPGPYRVKRECEFADIEDPDPNVLCIVADSDEGECIVAILDAGQFESMEQCEATARLLASAPDMAHRRRGFWRWAKTWGSKRNRIGFDVGFGFSRTGK